MFSFGFYNSKNGDRKYNATHFGKMFDGIIQDGVFGAAPTPLNGMFNVVPKEQPNLQITINPGKAWLMHTWNILDSKSTITFNQCQANNKRTDVIVIEVNNNYTDLSGSEPRTNAIKVVEGSNVLVSSPDAVPALTQIWNTDQTERRIWQYPIAYVTVYGSDYDGGTPETQFEASKIKSNNIQSRINVAGETDANKFITWTPLVSGATMSTDLSEYFPDWEAEFDEMIRSDTAEFNQLIDTFSGSMGGNFVIADVSQGFQGVLRYYELINGQYIPTMDTTPDPTKTYYVFDNSSSIQQLNIKLDAKILYGSQLPPLTLDPGQVYFQVE